MEKILNLTSSEYKDLQSYCKLNKLNEDDIIKNSYIQGIKIEMYGLLSGGSDVVVKEVEKIVEKRVEIPVEVIKEVVKIEYVEVPVEVIKEVEKIVEVEKIFHDNSKIEEINEKFSTKTKKMEKIFHKEKDELLKRIQELENKPPVEITKEVIVEKEPDNKKMKALEQTLQKLKMSNIEKDKKIKELETNIERLNIIKGDSPVTYLRGSNLNQKM
jgi:hypothetical protein